MLKLYALEKAYEYFLRRGYTVPKHYLNVSDDVNIDSMEEVVSHLTMEFRTGKYKNVHLIYQHFKSTFEQNATTRQVLPINFETVRLMIRDILPKHGKYSDHTKMKYSPVYTIEQNYETLFDSIFSSLVEIMLYHALLESKASEHSARMVAMKTPPTKPKTQQDPHAQVQQGETKCDNRRGIRNNWRNRSDEDVSNHQKEI